jgi:hypothetical protein
VLTNFLNARGDAAIEIDADLQDPPELIGEFLGLLAKRLQGRVDSIFMYRILF